MKPSVTGEAVGGGRGQCWLAMEGDDKGSQAGNCAVGAVNEECDLRRREGVALSMRPLYHTAAIPHSCHCNRALAAISFPVKAALAVGRRRMASQWDGAGLRYCGGINLFGCFSFR